MKVLNYAIIAFKNFDLGWSVLIPKSSWNFKCFYYVAIYPFNALAPAEDIEELQKEVEIEIKEPIKKEPTRWVAFAPTSYHQGSFQILPKCAKKQGFQAPVPFRNDKMYKAFFRNPNMCYILSLASL